MGQELHHRHSRHVYQDYLPASDMRTHIRNRYHNIACVQRGITNYVRAMLGDAAIYSIPLKTLTRVPGLSEAVNG